ncbi:agamous-like MADS-box protein AP1 [Arachis stenosperma]|uniref:agamous-like MADS-box protein AP1 n=1 Tax=Arachis stenosperma TaxID=217475 RepID=UPI0025AC3CA0|nr:agamous-like MADS-box protein AP1 [Arachis stenosperma]
MGRGKVELKQIENFNTGKLSHFSSHSSVENILERYERHVNALKINGGESGSQGNYALECLKLRSKVEALERNTRNLAGNDLDSLSLRELQNLEHQLEASLKRIRGKKNNNMKESISLLHKKAKALQERKSTLTKEIKDKEKTVVVEGPECWVEQTLMQSPQRSLPALTLGL